MTDFAERFLRGQGHERPRPNTAALADVARVNAGRAAEDLVRNLTALARLGAAEPQDLQLLAAIASWTAGDLS